MLLRLWVLHRYAETPYSALQMGDMKFYHEWAVRILHGQWTDGRAFYGLPGYAFLLAGFYKVLGTNFPVNWLVIAVVQTVFEALTATLIFRIAKRVCESESQNRDFAGFFESQARPATVAGLLASAAYIFFVPAQSFSIILMPTAWLVCLFWFCVWVAMGKSEGFFSPWWGLGVLIGLMAMTIATILFVLPLLVIGIICRVGASFEPQGRLWRVAVATLLLFLGVGIGTAPAWIHNYFIARDPVLLSAHGGLNFWMGNNPGATGYPKIPEGLRPSQDGLLRDSIKWVEAEAGHPLPRTEVSRYWSAKANAYIREHPLAWLRLMAVKIRNFWNAFQYDDISVITLLRERGVTLPGPGFGLVAAGGLAGMLLGWRNQPARFVAAAVLLHMAALLSVFITERYRLAAAPGLIILATYAGWRLWSGLKFVRWGEVGTVAALVALASVFVFWPTRDPALWSVDPYNMGVKELDVAERYSAKSDPESRQVAETEFAHARRHLDQAYALLPGNAGICFALGNWELDHGHRAEARRWYERTCELNPQYASALKNLGYMALEEQQYANAERLLGTARELEPDNATTSFLLAKTKLALGDAASARSLLEEALRLKPAEPEFLALQAQFAAPLPPP